jgi:hypothetical protein
MKFPWKYILVSFLVGLLLGGAGGMAYWRHTTHQWIRTSPERFLKHLDREVHLDQDQRTQIQTLLNGDRDKMVAYLETLRKTTRAEIRARLSPDQQTRFDAMMARHDAERKKREPAARP